VYLAALTSLFANLGFVLCCAYRVFGVASEGSPLADERRSSVHLNKLGQAMPARYALTVLLVLPTIIGNLGFDCIPRALARGLIMRSKERGPVVSSRSSVKTPFSCLLVLSELISNTDLARG
jgi:hypothetical protein